MFELQTPDNRVVVPVDTARIVLTGVRHVPSLHETRPEPVARAMGWDTVSSIGGFTSLGEVQAAANALSPTHAEGFVLVFGGLTGVEDLSGGAAAATEDGSTGVVPVSPPFHFNRLKVKSRRYVLCAMLPELAKTGARTDPAGTAAGGTAAGAGAGAGSGDEEAPDTDALLLRASNRHRLLEIVQLGEAEEFQAAFPGVSGAFAEIKAAYDGLARAMEAQLEAAEAAVTAGSADSVGEAVRATDSPKAHRAVLARVVKSGGSVRGVLACAKSSVLYPLLFPESV